MEDEYLYTLYLFVFSTVEVWRWMKGLTRIRLVFYAFPDDIQEKI